MKKTCLALLVAVLAAGCATYEPGISQDLLAKIKKGDSRKDVIRTLGRAHYRYKKKNVEFLEYGWDEDGDGKADVENRLVVMLVDGQVYEVGPENHQGTQVSESPAIRILPDDSKDK